MKKKTTFVIWNILIILLLIFSSSQVMAQTIVLEADWPAQGERSANKQAGFSYNGPGTLTVTQYFEPVVKRGNLFSNFGGVFPCGDCRLGEYMKMGGSQCYQNGKKVGEPNAGSPARCESIFFLTESKRYYGTFELGSIFWTNPAMSHQEGPQHVKAVISYKPDSSTSIPVAPAGSGKWKSVGTGDCPGRDIASSKGPNPDPAKCTDTVRGQTAVCWDQVCTYKNIATGSCTGGVNPGRMYTCDGQTAQPVNIGNWQSVGTGDCPGRDVSKSTGANPDPAKCTDSVRGQTAVCWDQGCTYKNIATGSCTGGVNPGRMYTCGPTGQNSPADKPGKESVIFYNGNDVSVSAGGRSPRFSIGRPVRITYLFTYHYGYNGVPGKIRIISATGAEIGNWQAQGRSASPKPSWYWEIKPEVVLQPGTYLIETSNSGTWSQNAGSGGNGMVQIKGVYLNP